MAALHENAHDALAMVTYGSEPSVLLFADSAGAEARGRAAAERAGCRVLVADGLTSAAERLHSQVAVDAVLVELDGAGEGVAALLAGLGEGARAGRLRGVVSAPETLIDLVAATAWHPDVLHLCGASDDERVAAITLAAAPQRPVLHDINRAEGSGLLQQLSEEVGRIANILAAMSDEEPSAPAKAPAGPRAKRDEVAVDAPFIRSVIRARRLRDRYFQGALFADPAWDMLLDLMAARLEGTRVPVSSLCIAAAVPATTALRWIKALTDRGLFLRSADPEDGRRVYIELSEDAARAMNAYFRMLQRTSPAVI